MFKCQQKRDIVLFLGSGISLPTGLPTTDDLTRMIINDHWHNNTDLTFSAGENHNPFFEEDNIVPRLQKIFQIIMSDAIPYIENRRVATFNYEDLYFVCSQIYQELTYEIDNPIMTRYIDFLNDNIQQLLEPLPHSPYIDLDLQYVSQKSLDFIQCVIWNKLSTNKKPNGLKLILDLINLNEIKNVHIGTLNHDTLIEALLDCNDIHYTDGFGDRDGDIRWFTPSVYENNSNQVNLYKLHGSVNWHIFRTADPATGITNDNYAITLNPDVNHCKNGSGQYLDNINITPQLLTGSYNKILNYNFGIIKKIHTRFDIMLEKNNIIIMSGYGWNDKGINGKLFDWLFLSRNNKIILLHENPIKLRDESKSGLWHRYEHFVQTNQLIPINKWLMDTTLEDIAPLLI